MGFPFSIFANCLYIFLLLLSLYSYISCSLLLSVTLSRLTLSFYYSPFYYFIYRGRDPSTLQVSSSCLSCFLLFYSSYLLFPLLLPSSTPLLPITLIPIPCFAFSLEFVTFCLALSPYLLALPCSLFLSLFTPSSPHPPPPFYTLIAARPAGAIA